MPEVTITTDEDSSLLHRLEDLSLLAQQFRDREPLKALSYCEEALKMIDNDSSLQLVKADILLSYAVSLYRTGDYGRSLQVAEQVKTFFGSSNDKANLARCLSVIGNIYHDLDDYASAIHFHQESLRIYSELNDLTGIASSYNNLGIVFSSTQDIAESIKFFEKCLEIRQALGNPINIAMAEMNLANAYSSSNQPLVALEHYEISLTLFRQENHQYGESLTLANIANEYFVLNSYVQARSYLHESQRLCEAIANKPTLAYCYKTFGEISAAEQLIDDAERCFLKAIDLYDSLKFLKEHHDVLTLLSKLYYTQGKFEQAFKSLESANDLNKQFLSEEKQRQIAALKIRYESERYKQESEIYRLRNDELAEANRLLREANQFKLDLIALVSHDLKNPLQTILGFSELIRSTILIPEHATPSIDEIRERLKEVHLMLEHVIRSGNFMLSLVKELLDSTAIESNKFQLDLQPYSLSELLDHAVAAYQPVASLKRQVLEADIAPNCLAIIDASRIQQVLHNLIDNAIKFSPLGKGIYVSLKRIDSQTAEIRIRDEGQGFSENDLKKAFGRFQKLSSIPTGQERSTGLGLSLCKQLVELHHGKIWIESPGKNQGATIVIQLRLAEGLS